MKNLIAKDGFSIANEAPQDYVMLSLSFLEEANAKLSVAKTILDSQQLVDSDKLEKLFFIQNQIDDYIELLK